MLNHWDGLRFSPPVAEEKEEAPRKNPKRVQREIQRQLAGLPTSTRSQQALSLQREAAKSSDANAPGQSRETQRQERFALRQKKRKEKHRGR